MPDSFAIVATDGTDTASSPVATFMGYPPITYRGGLPAGLRVGDSVDFDCLTVFEGGSSTPPEPEPDPEPEQTPVYPSLRHAVLALFDRTNFNGTRLEKADLKRPTDLPYSTFAAATFNLSTKKIEVIAGRKWSVEGVNFDGWIIDVKGHLETDNCIIGNPDTDLRNENAPYYAQMYPGGKWTSRYTSILSRGDYSNASRQIIKVHSPPAGGDADDFPIFNWYRCRIGGTGSDSLKPSRGWLTFCYFDPAVISDYNVGTGVHSDTITVQQSHPIEGVKFLACYISNDGTHRPPDFPFPDRIITDETLDVDRNNVIRFDAHTARNLGYPYGPVWVHDCVLRPSPINSSYPFQFRSSTTTVVQYPEFARCQLLTLNINDRYWYGTDDEPIRWDRVTGPGGEALPKPTPASVEVDAGPEPTWESWDDPALFEEGAGGGGGGGSTPTDYPLNSATITVTGPLPLGLQLDGTRIHGTVAEAGAFSVSITVDDDVIDGYSVTRLWEGEVQEIDTSPPVLTEISAAKLGAGEGVGSVRTDTAGGTLYHRWYTADATPTEQQVIDGFGDASSGSKAVENAGTYNVYGFGLDESEYVLKAFHVDAHGNRSAIVTSAPFSMGGAAATIRPIGTVLRQEVNGGGYDHDLEQTIEDGNYAAIAFVDHTAGANRSFDRVAVGGVTLTSRGKNNLSYVPGVEFFSGAVSGATNQHLTIDPSNNGSQIVAKAFHLDGFGAVPVGVIDSHTSGTLTLPVAGLQPGDVPLIVGFIPNTPAGNPKITARDSDGQEAVVMAQVLSTTAERVTILRGRPLVAGGSKNFILTPEQAGVSLRGLVAVFRPA